jgi:hypothetical protein
MITLNEGALQRLLQSDTGPVGRDLARRAQNVTAQATANASGEILGIRTGRLHSQIRYRIESDAQGLRAIIGSDAKSASGFSYPAFQDQNGRPWLTSALARFNP